jgi:ketosteroid isomerase-like protein
MIYRMTKAITALCAMLLLSGALPAAENDTAQFKALIRQYYEGWSSMNPDIPGKLYAKDATLVFYDAAPLKYTGWEDYKRGVQKNMLDGMASATLSHNDDLAVTRRGNVAWTTVTGHLSAKMKDGKAMEVDIRHTAIWEKHGGKWLIVHDHISAPLQ